MADADDGATHPLRVLMFGATGQVATELRRLAAAAPEKLTLTALDRAAADLSDPQACARAVAAADVDAVINAAAYTNVDKAESEEALAETINAAAPGAMAAAAAARGLAFAHVSTDFVFDGAATTPQAEDAPVAPLGAYGRTKLSGERAVLAAHPGAAILRTTRVFAAHGVNWVRSMLRAAETRPELRVVADQISGPTAAHDIAATLLVVARARARGAGEGGVFHYCAAPLVSMLDFTREMFRLADWAAQPTILASRTADWPTPAQRPLTPLMDCRKIAAVYGVPQPDWRPALARVLAELKESRE